MNLFISYRRQEASRIAGLLYDSLTAEFGESSVYLDIDFIRPGVNFLKSISEAIGRSGIVLVLIGSRWLSDADGTFRLRESQDAVRYEIETALSRGVPVLPLLLEGTTMPKRASLPISIAEIADLNALAVSLRSYDSDVRSLVATVAPYVQNTFESPDRGVSGMPFHSAGVPAPAADAEQGVVAVGEERSVLLERLLWTYNEHLDHAFDHGLGNLHPSLHWTAEAVARPRALVAEPTASRESVSAIQNSSVLDLFDTTGGLLGDGTLILGGPGAGKTTALLQMSRGLAARSLQDGHHPIPVYLSLTSWPHRAKPISEWLADECWQMYNVPRELARRWIEDGSLLFVLDDLDQVSGTMSRSRCVSEINQFNRFARQRRVPVLVGSRTFEYELLPRKLQLEAAITIQSLDAHVVANYLSDMGLVGSTDRLTAQRQSELLSTLTSPLLVTMFVQTAAADGGRGFDDLRRAKDAGAGQEDAVDRAIISSYVQRRLELVQGEFEVRGLRRYKQEGTLHWLSELARGLNQQMQAVLVVGRLGPSWLSTLRARVLAMVLPGMLLAATLGLITTGGSVGDRLVNSCYFALFGGAGPCCHEFLRGRASRGAETSARRLSVVSAIMTAVPAAVVVTIITGDFGDGLDWALSGGLVAFLAILTTRHTEPAERLSWSWRAALRRAPAAIRRGIAVGLVSGCATLAVEALYLLSQHSDITPDLVLAATIAVSVGSLFGMATLLFAGFVVRLLPMHKSPNEAIVRSLSNGIFIGMVSFFASFIVLGVFGSLVFGRPRGTAFGAELGGVLGVVVGFAYGLNAAVQYLVVRFLLWRYGSAPLRYVRWLDYSVQLRILYRGGASGGYVFIHRSVQDYFAGRNG